MREASSVINVGVIGCGHWGPNHVRVFSQLTGSRTVACSDLDTRRIEAVRSLFPEVTGHTDYHELLARPDVHAVVIAAPTRFHAAIVRDSLNAGKHVLCEKPLCVEPSDAAALAELAKQRGLILMVGHVFLFNAGIVKLKDLLAQQAHGQLRYLRATRTNLGPIRSDVNSVYDLATHDIAIFNWLLGTAPEAVSAVGGRFLQPTIEDVAFVSLRYPGNILANVQVSWLDPKKVREIVVVGDRKMYVWDELAPAGPVAIYDKGVDRPPNYEDYGQFQLLTREGDLTIPKIKMEEPLKAQNRFFLQAIRSGKLELNDGAFSTDVVRVLEAIRRSLAADGAMTPVPTL